MPLLLTPFSFTGGRALLLAPKDALLIAGEFYYATRVSGKIPGTVDVEDVLGVATR